MTLRECVLSRDALIILGTTGVPGTLGLRPPENCHTPPREAWVQLGATGCNSRAVRIAPSCTQLHPVAPSGTFTVAPSGAFRPLGGERIPFFGRLHLFSSCPDTVEKLSPVQHGFSCIGVFGGRSRLIKVDKRFFSGRPVRRLAKVRLLANIVRNALLWTLY